MPVVALLYVSRDTQVSHGSEAESSKPGLVLHYCPIGRSSSNLTIGGHSHSRNGGGGAVGAARSLTCRGGSEAFAATVADARNVALPYLWAVQ